ncbi:secreted RxLR effector protein [Trifolium repens]|nr:secreted RxLR effector protein [Trifolium repens]
MRGQPGGSSTFGLKNNFTSELDTTLLPKTLRFWVVCGVKVSCGPGALAHGVSPELPRTPQQWYQSDLILICFRLTTSGAKFDMKDLGAAKRILGMEIHRDRGARKLWLSQKSYVEKVLNRFDMSNSKAVTTPLANHFKLTLDQCPKSDSEIEYMSKVPYVSAVGCLMYAMVCTRPDLAPVVSQVCKFMSKPGKHHWEAVKWIFRYLKGTTGHGIMFSSEKCDPSVVGYVDSHYAGDMDDRRSTTGYVFTLAGGPICWKSSVQSIVAMSTTEAKYMAVAEAAKEALWLTGLVKELGVEQGGVQLHCDSQSVIYLAKNQVYHARTKHIDVRFHKIRELLTTGQIVLEKVHTSENAADMLTKPVTSDKFKHCLDLLHNILTDLTRLGVQMDDEDKAIILLCSLPSSYDHLVTTLTYGKETITLTSITSALLSHGQRRQNSEGGSQGEGLYVQGGSDRGRNKGKAGSGKKRSKSKNRKTAECYGCKQIGHWKRDCPNRKHGSSTSANIVQTDDSCMELAGLKTISVVPHPHLHDHDDDGGENNSSISSIKKNKKRRSKKKNNNNNTVLLGGGKHKLMMMHNNIWQTMIIPVKRLCLALSTTINHRKNGAGLVKLQDDVQTCEYEDVQVMWEMLHKTETHVIDNRNKRPFWRVFLWSSSSSNHSSKASLQSSNHT